MDLAKAEPCWKTALSSGSKLPPVLPSNPSPNAIAGSEHEVAPKLSEPVGAPVVVVVAPPAVAVVVAAAVVAVGLQPEFS
jgi:hypothetical protein